MSGPVTQNLIVRLAKYARVKLTRWSRPVLFRIWRWRSLRRFGQMRPIFYRGFRFWVMSADWRGYWLATSRDVNPHTRVKVCALLDLKPELFVDVGANYGEFVAEAVQRGISTIAVEANPDVVHCLRSTFGDCANVEILQEAATNKDGEAVLATLPGLTGFSSLTASLLSNKTGPGSVRADLQLVRVRTRTLESMVGARPVVSLVIKVEVEGHEIDVIEGAIGLLSKVQDWWAILLEFDPVFLERRSLRAEEEFAKLIAVAPALGEYTDGRITWRPALVSDCPARHTDILLGSEALLRHPS